ncbi:hypothetical protein K431DRAFT_108986 [Polychaeton citri CBS 116435]|uniref:Uncharacterized protein n=1 Tax=Polychaeton citri CBS 116435 TaxID=1314669 RepID=A0A9P4Q2Y8_9PEZI|nr:hypothetical protein K431DRAFT_108986 [Polychaeton citri CBS 116435]
MPSTTLCSLLQIIPSLKSCQKNEWSKSRTVSAKAHTVSSRIPGRPPPTLISPARCRRMTDLNCRVN